MELLKPIPGTGTLCVYGVQHSTPKAVQLEQSNDHGLSDWLQCTVQVQCTVTILLAEATRAQHYDFTYSTVDFCH